MKKLIAGNWKMNGTLAEARSLAQAIKPTPGVDICICPPFLHFDAVKQAAAQGISLGMQNSALNENGAYTGEISATMIADAGAEYVILGHSERRQYFSETDENVAAKAKLVHQCGMIAIICVGETEDQRLSGNAESIVRTQLEASLPECATADNTVVAYEPVWAIGTGKTATPEDVKSMHIFIRSILEEKLDNAAAIRILYGGSVKPDNARELLHIDNVDGALVGGASLKPDQFMSIVAAAGSL